MMENMDEARLAQEYGDVEQMPDRLPGQAVNRNLSSLAQSVSWYATYHIDRDLIVNYWCCLCVRFPVWSMA